MESLDSACVIQFLVAKVHECAKLNMLPHGENVPVTTAVPPEVGFPSLPAS